MPLPLYKILSRFLHPKPTPNPASNMFNSPTHDPVPPCSLLPIPTPPQNNLNDSMLMLHLFGCQALSLCDQMHTLTSLCVPTHAAQKIIDRGANLTGPPTCIVPITMHAPAYSHLGSACTTSHRAGTSEHGCSKAGSRGGQWASHEATSRPHAVA